MVNILIQEGRLLPLDDQLLRYNLVLQAFEAKWLGGYPLLPHGLSKPVSLREGQTLASSHLTHLVMDELEFMRYAHHRPITALFLCYFYRDTRFLSTKEYFKHHISRLG